MAKVGKKSVGLTLDWVVYVDLVTQCTVWVHSFASAQTTFDVKPALELVDVLSFSAKLKISVSKRNLIFLF